MMADGRSFHRRSCVSVGLNSFRFGRSAWPSGNVTGWPGCWLRMRQGSTRSLCHVASPNDPHTAPWKCFSEPLAGRRDCAERHAQSPQPMSRIPAAEWAVEILASGGVAGDVSHPCLGRTVRPTWRVSYTVHRRAGERPEHLVCPNGERPLRKSKGSRRRRFIRHHLGFHATQQCNARQGETGWQRQSEAAGRQARTTLGPQRSSNSCADPRSIRFVRRWAALGRRGGWLLLHVAFPTLPMLLLPFLPALPPEECKLAHVAAVQSQARPGTGTQRSAGLPVARNSQHFHFLELAPERAEDRSPQDPRCIISTLCSLPTRLSGCLAVQNNPSLFWHTPRELIRRPLTPSGETAAACDSKGRGKTRDALPPGQVWPSASQVS
jgi:hypothetical protein